MLRSTCRRAGCVPRTPARARRWRPLQRARGAQWASLHTPGRRMHNSCPCPACITAPACAGPARAGEAGAACAGARTHQQRHGLEPRDVHLHPRCRSTVDGDKLNAPTNEFVGEFLQTTNIRPCLSVLSLESKAAVLHAGCCLAGTPGGRRTCDHGGGARRSVGDHARVAALQVRMPVACVCVLHSSP